MKDSNQTKGRTAWWFMALALFVGGIVTGIIIDRDWKMGRKPVLVEKREGGYMFISPLLECDSPQGIAGDQEVSPFQNKIEAYIEEALNKKRIADASVYFRDLTNGPSFGVNKDERFAPASLFKVPLMIAYFKMAESRPEILKEQLVYEGKQDFNGLKYFGASHRLEPGKRYTVEQLIEMMIVYSDNNATLMLSDHIDQRFEIKVYQDLGIMSPAYIESGKFKGDFISVEEYSSCFRILYNSSYLRRDLSERALRYLAYPDFMDGIYGGVPPGIAVAQKYGERAFDKTDIKELHDCGIIYYPGMPYLLCVMTKGTDFGVLAATIKDISAIVYTEVDRHQVAQKAERDQKK